MGYSIAGLASISLNDPHKYFAYFIPGHVYRNSNVEFINDYFKDEFRSLASAIGPDGVLVVPHERSVEQYISEIAGLQMNGCMFGYQDGFKTDEQNDMFHSGHPHLIITKSVLNESQEICDGIIIDLDSLPDVETLGELMHLLITAMRKNDLEYFTSNFKHWSEDREKQNLPDYLSALELKPNIFGIGFDLKKILTHINNRFGQDATLPKKKTFRNK